MKAKARREAALLDGARLAIPLTIGVVGHRDCLDRDKLVSSIRNFLGELRDTYPNTSIQILSSMADGADRWAAMVALDMKFDVIAPLPMPRDMFEQDFDEDSRREFDLLLSRTLEWFDLPLMAPREEVARDGPARNRQYEQAGAFIVRHSQIFLALWDGTPSTAVGGTAAAVHFRRHGVPAPYSPSRTPLDVPDTGPVYQIVTRRKSNPGGVSSSIEPGTVQVMLPDSSNRPPDPEEHGEPYYKELCASIDTFNRAGARLLEDNSAMVRKGADDLLGVGAAARSRPGAELRLPAASSGVRRIVAAYAAADSIALRHQLRSTRMMQLLFVLGGLMVLSFAIFSYQPKWTSALVVYLALFLSVAVSFRIGHVREHYDFFLDARALAEALRVQFFWRMAGSWEGVAQHYIRKQAEELRWIREAIRSLDIAPPFSGRLAEHLRWALHWIEGQSKYLDDSVAARTVRLRRPTKYAYWLYTGGLIVSLPVVLVSARRILQPDDPLLLKAVMLMGLLPAFAALLSGYAEFMSFEEDISRHARMTIIFERAKFAVENFAKELEDAAKAAGGQLPNSHDENIAAHRLHDLLHDLGSEALRENADWLLLHRSHRPKAQVT